MKYILIGTGVALFLAIIVLARIIGGFAGEYVATKKIESQGATAQFKSDEISKSRIPMTTDAARTSSILRCESDTDCKGDQICDSSACAAASQQDTAHAPFMDAAQIDAKAAISSESNNHDTSWYEEAYSCAIEAFKENYGPGPVAYCVGNSRAPSEIEEQAFKDAERDFINR